MLFWIFSGLFVVVSLAALFRTLMAPPLSIATTAEYDVCVYKDQLQELDRDIERGLITVQEAARARTEISRRLIAAAERVDDSTAGGSALPWQKRRTIAIIIGGVMLIAPISIYSQFGKPDQPSQPFSARQEQRLIVQQQVKEISAQLEALAARLKQNPGDLEGWYVLGRAYMEIREFEKAIAAFDDAIAATGVSARLLIAKAIALISADGGVVAVRTENVLRQALEIEPASGVAQYFVGLALAQRQDLSGALALWRQAIGNAPADAPWLEAAKDNAARAEKELALSAIPPATGPGADDLAAASNMTEQERKLMIAGMVGRLSARLEENPDDLEGWLQLIRSYGVLGDLPAAHEALTQARESFAGDDRGLERLNQAEKALIP